MVLKMQADAVKGSSLTELIHADIMQYYHFSSDFSRGNMTLLKRLSIFLTPPLLCVTLYRLAHLCHKRRWFRTAQFLTLVNFLLHKAYISPESEIAGGLYIPHTVGVSFCGSAGKNLTLYAW